MQEHVLETTLPRAETSTDELPPRRQWPRVGLPVGILLLCLVLLGWALWVARDPRYLWAQGDLRIYLDGAKVFRQHPAQLYSRSLGGRQHLPFMYPPFAALLFSLVAWLPFGVLKVATVVVALVSVVACALSVLVAAGRSLGRGTVGLALALSALVWVTDPVQQTLLYGQVNLLLMALVVVDILLIRGRASGIGVGLAAGFKLVPLIFIPYLLVIRAYRAAAVATATFLATILVTFVVSPGASAPYWGGVFYQPGRVEGNAWVGNQALYGVLLRLHGGRSLNRFHWVEACALVAVLGFGVAARQFRLGQRCFSVFTVAVVGLLISPLSWSHHWVWVEILLGAILLETRMRPAWRAALAATVLAIFLAWPLRMHRQPLLPWGLIWTMPHSHGAVESRWHGSQLVVGNLYAIVAVGYLLAAFVALVVTRRGPTSGRRDAADSPSEPTVEDAGSLR